MKLEKDSIFYRKLWSLMIPIVLQNLMLAMVAVADAFMLGGMNQNYMSAVSLATQIQFIQNMFLSAATASLGILGAQYWGKGDIRTLDAIFCIALRLCGLVSVIFFAGCVFFIYSTKKSGILYKLKTTRPKHKPALWSAAVRQACTQMEE